MAILLVTLISNFRWYYYFVYSSFDDLDGRYYIGPNNRMLWCNYRTFLYFFPCKKLQNIQNAAYFVLKLSIFAGFNRAHHPFCLRNGNCCSYYDEKWSFLRSPETNFDNQWKERERYTKNKLEMAWILYKMLIDSSPEIIIILVIEWLSSTQNVIT